MTKEADRCTRALAAVEEIEQVLKDYMHGTPNPDAVALIEKATFTLETAGVEPVAGIHVKAQSVLNYARILYSERRHKRWDGPEPVALLLRQQLAGVRMIIHGAQRREELTTD